MTCQSSLSKTKKSFTSFAVIWARVFDEHYDDKDTESASGDGYTAGTIARKDREVALHTLMYPPK